MAREPREQLVVDLLTDGWVAANTFGLTPSILYASRDEPDSPHVTVEQPDEGPINGGVTGFSHMDGAGAGPGQTRAGTVTLHAYADDQQLADASTGSAAVYLTGTAENDGTVKGGVIDEIYRVIGNNNVRPTNPTTENTPVDLLSAGQFQPGPTDGPTKYHYVGSLAYLYHD